MATSTFRWAFTTLDGVTHDSQRDSATNQVIETYTENMKDALRATDGVFNVVQANGDLVLIPHHALAHVTLIKG